MASKGTGDSDFEREYAGSTATLNQARQDVCDFLISHGLDHHKADAELIVSELAANAVDASPNSPYQVLTRIDPEQLVISVTNRSESSPPPETDWQVKSVLAPQGRGLGIVKALSDELHVESSASHVVVSASLRLATAK